MLIDFLRHILRSRPEPISATDVVSFWNAATDGTGFEGNAFEAAVTRAFRADRLAFAFAAGYQGALRGLFGDMPVRSIGSFCATEEKGNRPAVIETRVEAAPGGYRVCGRKKWSTLAPVADVLFVVADSGEEDEAGRKRLRVVRVPRESRGVVIDAMPQTPFIPEVEHGSLRFENVDVPSEALLDGDGYELFLKPFRTIEDLHVHGSVLGYVLGVAMRYDLARTFRERVVQALVAVHTLSSSDVRAAEVHVALAGLLSQSHDLLREFDASWQRDAQNAERERWDRDCALLSVAAKVREQRRSRAWQRIEEEAP